MQTNRFRHRLTKILVDIMFYGGILTCAALPFILPTLLAWQGVQTAFRVQYTVVLFGSGLCAVYIMYQLKRMFKTLVGGNPFVVQNVSCLRKCAVASAAIAGIFLIRQFMWFTIAGTVTVIIF
ncbi:MAG: DUF2975 domain-containing protein, partial [Defluviitaleaceae bacterium]|nr:DUF2975 domain-containing protein [Defluviitaleaceae bacterium]